MRKYPQGMKMIDMDIIQRYLLLSESKQEHIAKDITGSRDSMLKTVRDINNSLYELF